MGKARKSVKCNCGAMVKINLMTYDPNNNLNCPLCGQKINTAVIKKAFEKFTLLRNSMENSYQPYASLACYNYNRAYA